MKTQTSFDSLTPASDPSSVPLELETIVLTLPITVQPILAASQKREFSMFSSLSTHYHWVLPIYRYADLQSVLATFNEKVLAPAEQQNEIHPLLWICRNFRAADTTLVRR